MPSRTVETKVDMLPCPKCGNTNIFSIISRQVCEDGCEVWAVCKCGHPTPSGSRFESVMGGTDDYNANMALHCWNDSLKG